jgi:predicted secreted Zn-dependent protease
MMKKILAFIVFLAAVVSALAAVDGRHALADENGRDNSLIVNESFSYYEVKGNSDTELQNQIKQKGPEWDDGQRYDSLTSWSLACDHRCHVGSDGCSCTCLKVVLDIAYYYPKWVHDDKASPELVDKWNTYLQKLTLHEHGHRDIAIKAATDLSQALAQIPPLSSCGELDRRVRMLNREYVKKVTELQSAYDISTNHGLTQGAIFK